LAHRATFNAYVIYPGSTTWLLGTNQKATRKKSAAIGGYISPANSLQRSLSRHIRDEAYVWLAPQDYILNEWLALRATLTRQDSVVTGVIYNKVALAVGVGVKPRSVESIQHSTFPRVLIRRNSTSQSTIRLEQLIKGHVFQPKF